ncbi:MAG: ABC transporter ATP-binding protein [Pelagibacteraceae bacterium]|jgi:oligopeptide/dipeptide ABC transporter ATP-binding protein|nr:ABC transporter ATP-binding protein [Pelagibacteraceae bacterium]MBT3902296.1 ABC transporter ATP-binding protein [Pelagibacteraceae bacterium]MBT5213364.1 ABC transporter ATP-binding protein [Pelagibacteraceae bacterium]MBT6197308.1 ABC transporter ATP-binding protein [Pelagibacteraceae bacterium]MBT6353846.1 ABC transporter ATP-binding protein [Pelagibacteraceae bacterium]
MSNQSTQLEVKNLTTCFKTSKGDVVAVDDISFSIKKGETLCIVGESGCGKSVSALSVMGLLPTSGYVKSGSAIFQNNDLLLMSSKELEKFRGNRLSMIFQDPGSSLNPVMRVGDQVSEIFQIHLNMSKHEGLEKALEMLKQVEIPDPESRMLAFPHELSGGMAQRIMIAIALACNPDILIADEPTTALDVTIQSQILNLMSEMQLKTQTAIILITHDLGVVAEMADNVLVMYCGQIVEYGDVKKVFNSPIHPYTKALMKSIPVIGKKTRRLDAIPGRVPSLDMLPSGCRFEKRCIEKNNYVLTNCQNKIPPIFSLDSLHGSRCWLEKGNE